MSALDLSLSDRLRGLSDKLPPEHKNLLLEAALRVDTLELKERAWKRMAEYLIGRAQELADAAKRYL